MKAQCPSCGTEFECRPAKQERDAMWDAVIEICGIDAAHMTASARADIGKTVKELIAAGASPAQVRVASDAWRRKHDLDDVSVHSLRNRWPEMVKLVRGSEGLSPEEQARVDQQRLEKAMAMGFRPGYLDD